MNVKQLARLGGIERAKKLTAKRRQEIARMGGLANGKRKKAAKK
jgi:hypothetical protein